MFEKFIFPADFRFPIVSLLLASYGRETGERTIETKNTVTRSISFCPMNVLLLVKLHSLHMKWYEFGENYTIFR